MDCYNLKCSYRHGSNTNKYYCSVNNCAIVNGSLRRCGNDWRYCDGNCYNCQYLNYRINIATVNKKFENAKSVDVFSDLAEQKKEETDWKAEIEMKLFRLNEEIIRLRKVVENNDYKPKD